MPQFIGIFVWLLMALAFRPALRFYGLSMLWAPALPVIAAMYMAFTLDSAYQHARGRGGMWKGRAQANVSEAQMNDATHDTAPTNWRSGKGHRDENFPVASFLIHPRHRGAILAFYNFVRTADDIADHATLAPPEKLALLDRLEAGLLGANADDRGRGAAARGARRAQSCRPSTRRISSPRSSSTSPSCATATGTI